jgi:RNA polymerase sigma factor (sigma-70 family)
LTKSGKKRCLKRANHGLIERLKELMTDSQTTSGPPPGEITRVVEHCFRHEAGRMVSTLTRIFGAKYLNLAEDVVQEALARALQTWLYYGIPRNPAAWITQVSKNLALDLIRRDKVFRNKEIDIARFRENASAFSGGGDSVSFKDEIRDDRLWMMFMCCHPLVPREAQVALALKTLCGFSAGEIAKAFLTSEAAIAKRLTRAKRKIREASIPFDLPAGDELKARLDGVLQILYLLFNEGYKASEGKSVIRKELCQEAIRLCALLAGHPVGNRPRVHALLALMLLNGARLPARVDSDGNFLRLKDQDRSCWDPAMIARGLFHMMRSTESDEVSVYHLQAGIAACHCAAKDYESTDWTRILHFYDLLINLDDSPVVALNRSVAIAKVHSPRAGIEAVESIRDREQLNSYYLLYAVLGEFEELLSNRKVAANYFRKSLELATMMSERKFLMQGLRALEGGRSGT